MNANDEEVLDLHYNHCSLTRCDGGGNHSGTPYCCQSDQVTPILISCSGAHVQALLQMNELVLSQPSAASCTCQPCSGVTFELVGRVRGPSGGSIPMARVYLSTGGRVTLTNKDGLFSFKLNATVTSVELAISAGGYHTISLPVELNPGLHRMYIINITLNPEWVTVLDIPRPNSSTASVLVTVASSRTVVAVHKGRLRGEDGVGTVLSLPESFKQSFLEAGFAVAIGIHCPSTTSLQTTPSSLLVVTEIPSLEYSHTGAATGSPVNFTLSSVEDEVLLARGLFRLRLYVYSAGKLYSASEILKDVANFTFQLIQTKQTGSDVKVFSPSANQGYTQQTSQVSTELHLSNRKRRKIRQTALDPDRAVLISASEVMDELPEYFLVGTIASACFVGVRAFSSEGDEKDGVHVSAMIFSGALITVTTSTTPACLYVPCPRNASRLATISATDSTRITYTPESFVSNLQMSSPFLFPNRTSCQYTSLHVGAHESRYIAFKAPSPTGDDTSLPPSAPTPVNMSSISVRDPPYCFLKIAVPQCDISDVRVYVASHSSAEVSTARAEAMEEPETDSSGMYCESDVSFCLPFVCSSNVSVRVETWLPNAVEPDFCEPASAQLDYYNRDTGVLVLPLATTMAGSTLNDYAIFYSSSSQHLAYTDCQNSPHSTVQYNRPTQ